jgi:predicted neuraminidase
MPCMAICGSLYNGKMGPATALFQALIAFAMLIVPQPSRITTEDIFTSAPFASSHASTIVELHNGDLMAAWFGGSAEGHSDVAIWGARHTKDGWSKPTLLVREPDIAAWNPVLFHTEDGRLWLYYKFGPVAAGWTGARMVSTDDGATWSASEHLPAGLLGPIRTKPFVGPHGLVLSGSSTESYHAWAVWIERSIDGGQTFARLGPYTLPNPAIHALAGSALNGINTTVGKTGPEQTTGLIQPTVLWLGGHHFRFYARGTTNISRICIADSLDDGASWTTPRALDIPNPNSGLDVVRLRDGRFVLIYNPTTEGRSPLALAVSKDGEHFRSFFTLESEAGQEFSYPAIIQLANGDLAATYTYHRTRIRFASIPLATIPTQ